MTRSILPGLAFFKGINNFDTKVVNLTENFEQELRKKGKPYFYKLYSSLVYHM
jgi:hypothetical protein